MQKFQNTFEDHNKVVNYRIHHLAKILIPSIDLLSDGFVFLVGCSTCGLRCLVSPAIASIFITFDAKDSPESFPFFIEYCSGHFLAFDQQIYQLILEHDGNEPKDAAPLLVFF
jgi:hypothetical protein